MGRPLAEQPRLPSSERLADLLVYNLESGKLFWRSRAPSTFPAGERMTSEWQANLWESRYARKEAGSMSGGYHRVFIDGKPHLSHRVIWKMMTGEDPSFIDHLNGDRADNRMANLRDVTHAVNMKNKSLYVNNTSGFPGVEHHVRDGVWIAKIGVDGAQVHLGNFATKGEAVAARVAAQVMLDYHQNHGRSKPTSAS